MTARAAATKTATATMTLHDCPALNATLNACATSFLIIGLVCIKAKQAKAHAAAMCCALVFSAAFLVSYLYYHWHVGDAKFQGQGWVRPLYFTILLTHIPLAIINLPLVFMTVIPALRERFDAHRRWARWTFPVWLYVSVTGVLVYFMCHVWYGPPVFSAAH
jgi:putative membrane protein